MGTRRKKYTDDFKRDAVRMMRDRGQRTVAQVADDLGVEAGHLHRWAKKFDQEIVAKRNPQGETLEEEIGGCARRTNGCEWRRPY